MGVRYCMGVLSPSPLTKNLLIIDNAREREIGRARGHSAASLLIFCLWSNNPATSTNLIVSTETLSAANTQTPSDSRHLHGYILQYILCYIYNMYLCGRRNKITVSNSDSEWSVRQNQLANPLKIDGIHFHRHIDSCPHGSSWGSSVCGEGGGGHNQATQ